ncbi:MAG TPA: VIT1/CCC1 transporter family protein [Candidatus Limnocylindrales bacterium]|jgi:VIT1/CCC1 family predicted Fe2+/Mn2+ transporter|nr:VIT1/CCC1 transporter family protein [Candidatus Limnocylindrales bacterium]
MPLVDPRESLNNLRLERDAIALYDALADIEPDGRRAAAFRKIAGNERRHADVWAGKLRAQGIEVPPARKPRLRVRMIITVARLFGTHAVADLVRALEGDEENAYERQASPEVAAIAADEREHAEIWKRLGDSRAIEAGRVAITAAPSRDGVREAHRVRTPGEIGVREGWHRSGRSGTLRAVIFGVSDGLVSNLSLVMGVAGASAQPTFILLAGIAGLLAGASSMAAGEYISMQSQRELFERQIALERAELEAMPDEEEAELAAVYRSKGFTEEEAARIAHRLFRDPDTALDTLVREELGLDPDELGSPWGAAFGSFVAFAVGALVPVIPYLFAAGSPAFYAALGASLAALFAVGSGVSLLTGRSTIYSGLRQVGIGMAAAAVTYAVGSVIGVAVA